VVEELMIGGVLSALAGVLLLCRMKKRELKWLFLTGLLEVCAQDLYVEDDPPQAARSTKADANRMAPKAEATRDN